LADKRRSVRATNGGPFYQIVEEGYMDDIDLFDCPSNPNMAWAGYSGGPRLIVKKGTGDPTAEEWYADGSFWPDEMVVGQQEYAYDLGRVAKDSVPGRVIVGDAMHMGHPYGANFHYSPWGHEGGSNVLYVDGAVQWAPREQRETQWNAWMMSLPNPGMVPGGQRSGFVANPRMDEDAYRFETLVRYGCPGVTNRDDLRFPNDHDDVYAVEGRSQPDWGVFDAVDQWSVTGDPDAAPVGSGGYTGGSWSLSRWNDEPGNWGVPGRLYKYWNGDWNGLPTEGWSRRSFFEEVGPFANENRWETHDARLWLWGSWLECGGSW
jgi:prepilin-type processing-associated H-X9-DG protein